MNKKNDINTIFKINQNNKLNMMIIDDFYEDPMSVRNFALSHKIDIKGHIPGYRSHSFSNDEIRNILQTILKPFGKIINLHIPLKYSNEDLSLESHNETYLGPNSGSFFINTSKSDIQWIHTDSHNYSAIIYLTPDAPIMSGTSTLKPINKDIIVIDKKFFDKTEWYEIDIIGNKFNRMLIFNSFQFHLPNNYFGINNEDGRLTQVIWFDIQPMAPIEYFNVVKTQYPCKLNPLNDCKFIVIDNIYDDPISVRNFALLQKFYITGNFPGMRTKSFLTNEIIKKIDNYLCNYNTDMSNIRNENYNCGSFQYYNSKNKSWVHKCTDIEWCGIIFLNPDAPAVSGITLYEYYDNEATYETMNLYAHDMTKWKEIDTIGNVFNRLILFNAKQWNMTKSHFGETIENCNLCQVFFI